LREVTAEDGGGRRVAAAGGGAVAGGPGIGGRDDGLVWRRLWPRPFREARFGRGSVASYRGAMPTRDPSGTGMLRLSAAILLIGGPILALILRSWGVGGLVFGVGTPALRGGTLGRARAQEVRRPTARGDHLGATPKSRARGFSGSCAHLLSRKSSEGATSDLFNPARELGGL
jgi:hypothetical protein